METVGAFAPSPFLFFVIAVVIVVIIFIFSGVKQVPQASEYTL
jgi:regulator of protease activity HflC (stomatin/prohibitin superfamily)